MKPPRSVLVRLGMAAIDRPRTALTLWATLAGLSALAASRIHPSGSLESILAGGEASKSLARIVHEFGVVDDLIVLVSAEPADPSASKRLSRFAEQFEAEIRHSPTLSAMCTDVAYRRMPELASFIRDHVVPAALFMVDDLTLAKVRERLSSLGIHEQIRRDEELISAPGVAGQTLAKAILRDPLRLHELLIESLADRFPALNPLDPEHLLLSNDGRTLMIRVTGARPASDLEFARTLTHEVSNLGARLNTDGLSVEYTGAYAIATIAERSIRADMIGTMSSSVAMLFLLFLLVYRSAMSFLFAIVPVGVGIVSAFGLGSFVFSELTPVAGAVGAVLAGLSIDYSIHFLTHFALGRAETADTGEAARRTLSHVAPAMGAACITSVIGFLAIAQSSVPALRQFAWLGALGLSIALLASVTLLPAMLSLAAGRALGIPQDRPHVRWVEPLVRWVMAHPSACALSVAAIGITATVSALSSPGELLRLEHDLSVMHPRPNRPLELQHTLAERFGFDPDALMIHLRADDPEELLRLAHRVDRAIRNETLRETGIIGTLGPASLFPDPAATDARREALRAFDSERIIADFRTAVSESMFDAGGFDGYVEFLRRLLTTKDPPSWNTLGAYPEVARLMLPRNALHSPDGPSEALAVAFADQARTDRSRRDAAIESIRGALHGIAGATLTSVSVVGYDTEHRVRHDLARLLGVSLLLVVAFLVIHFRSPKRAALAMIPALFGLLCLTQLADALDLRLNMVNLIGAPILVGTADDAGIFLVSIGDDAKRSGYSRAELAQRLGAGCEAVFMSMLTTVLSFGTLAFASTPAIQSLGIMLAVSMGASFVGVVFLLVPLLAILHRYQPACRSEPA